jgi:hypothetical protein
VAADSAPAAARTRRRLPIGISAARHPHWRDWPRRRRFDPPCRFRFRCGRNESRARRVLTSSSFVRVRLPPCPLPQARSWGFRNAVGARRLPQKRGGARAGPTQSASVRRPAASAHMRGPLTGTAAAAPVSGWHRTSRAPERAIRQAERPGRPAPGPTGSVHRPTSRPPPRSPAPAAPAAIANGSAGPARRSWKIPFACWRWASLRLSLRAIRANIG